MMLGIGLGVTMARAMIAAEEEGGTPAWVPEGATVHIDFINDRAWTADDGEVAIGTLLGTDAASVEVWGASSYDPASISAEGYYDPDVCAFIGAALTKILAGSTIRFQFQTAANEAAGHHTWVILSPFNSDGSEALQINFGTNGTTLEGEAWGGTYTETDAVSLTVPGDNCVAVTASPSRADLALNGALISSAALTTDDWPVDGTAFIAAVFHLWSGAPDTFIKTITIYDALPDTTGLSALSAVA